MLVWTGPEVEAAIDSYFRGSKYSPDIDLALQPVSTAKAYADLLARVLPGRNLKPATKKVFRDALSKGCIGGRAAAGIVIVAVGGVILAGTAHTGIAVGAVLVAGACVCWGIDNAITASLDSYSPAQVTLAKGIVAGSVNLTLGLLLGGLPSTKVIVVAILIGVFGYGLSITMWITGARLVGAARGQVIFALAPFIGALLAWPINSERLSTAIGVAFAVSLTGVLLIGTAHHTHQHSHVGVQHTHAIDPDDPHHAPDAIEVVAGEEHRHRALSHDHEHLPDVHHRHVH